MNILGVVMRVCKSNGRETFLKAKEIWAIKAIT